MARRSIVPFSEEHVEAAAALLAERHERHRSSVPQLPAGVDYAAEIAALLADGATGAYTEGAYVLGGSGPEHWGPNIWLDAAGHAAREPELLRDVWAEAAAGWFEQGLKEHHVLVLVPATDAPLVDAWFRLGFGAKHAYGVMEVPEREWSSEVREATEDDIEALVALGPLLSRHALQSPTFSSHPEQTARGAGRRARRLHPRHRRQPRVRARQPGRRELRRLPRRAGDTAQRARAASHRRVHHVGRHGPGRARERRRCRAHGRVVRLGAGARLRDDGRRRRVANLLGSRFWPRRGFRTSFLRLHRSLP